MLKIGNVKLKNNLVLAPMHNVNCNAFRLLCKDYGAGLVTTAMIHPQAIFHKAARIDLIDEERPVSCQLVGNDPDEMSVAANMLEDRADIIDLNFGCPDKNELKRKSGAYLLGRPEQLKKIASKVVSSVKCPVTAKIRSGLTCSSVNALEICRILQDCGISAIAIHARSAKQHYKGKADWSLISRLKEKISIPLIANGDVSSYNDYQNIQAMTCADFVMIGRAAIGNPMLFRSCLEKEELKKDAGSAYRMFSQFIDYYNKYSIKTSMPEARQHALWFAKGIRGSSFLKRKISEINSIGELQNAFSDFSLAVSKHA